MNASVPEGLSQLLEDFAVAVLREKPSDLVSFAAGYFNDLLKSRSRAVAGGSGSDSVTTVEVDMNADGDSDDGHQPSHTYRRNMDRRRKSVFAEPYDPSAHHSREKVAVGEHVIEQGDDGDNFYVIDSVMFDVYVSNGGESKLVFNYNNEGCFGELALMYNTPRAATVVATTPGVLWALDRHTFRRIICDAACRKRQMY